MNEKIPYVKPSITQKEIDYANDAVTNGWGEKCYEYINRFEKMFSEYLGVKHCIATSSCTGALHLGYKSLGIKKGDEVILADANWIACAAPITYVGATPVFADIDPISWCIDPSSVKKLITKNTKAISAVHLYGNICDIDSLNEISNKNNLFLIEDAAEAIGGIYKGQPAGSFGKFSTFSFHGTKTLTTGEGGMFATNDTKLYEKALILSNQGRNQKNHTQFFAEKIGFKYKMTNVQAAIGCAQLERVDELIKKQRENLEYYQEKLGNIDGISLNFDSAENVNSGWMPTVVFDKELGIDRDFILESFQAENIDARVFFYPLSSLPMFKKVDNKNSYSIQSRAINLPSFHEMSNAQLSKVCDIILKILQKKN